MKTQYLKEINFNIFNQIISDLLTVTATMPSNKIASYLRPFELICTASPLIKALKNHGKASPTSISNTFEPNVFDTPISTRPKKSEGFHNHSIRNSVHTLTNNDYATQCIWNTATCCKKCDPHNTIWYTECKTNNCYQPNHEISPYR